MRLSFRDIASRLTGISIPVFGVSWNPPESERKIVRDVLVFLEDRRMLFNDYAWEVEHEVADSVLRIRDELTQAIQRLSDGSDALLSLRAMRVSCREYLDNVRKRNGARFFFLLELGRLRALFGYHIAHLAVKYGIDIEGDLASIIPPELQEEMETIEAKEQKRLRD